MLNYTTPEGTFDKLLNAKEISELLNVSKPQAFLMIRRGDFPVVRMGRLVRVRQSDLEEYINNQMSPSKQYSRKLVWGISNEGRGKNEE